MEKFTLKAGAVFLSELSETFQFIRKFNIQIVFYNASSRVFACAIKQILYLVTARL